MLGMLVGVTAGVTALVTLETCVSTGGGTRVTVWDSASVLDFSADSLVSKLLWGCGLLVTEVAAGDSCVENCAVVTDCLSVVVLATVAR